ncbi:hypothetical protein A4A49_33977 [Nicotiana attenuata]|uniref:Uncharacterized protein n=1 Tax=Nicotiana attenuata TaxID=49451 RepID=A0A1J6JA94_NICAT|nr:hypothetical protein A4A49_33977 [Nicotiana attenuata]
MTRVDKIPPTANTPLSTLLSFNGGDGGSAISHPIYPPPPLSTIQHTKTSHKYTHTYYYVGVCVFILRYINVQRDKWESKTTSSPRLRNVRTVAGVQFCRWPVI